MLQVSPVRIKYLSSGDRLAEQCVRDRLNGLAQEFEKTVTGVGQLQTPELRLHLIKEMIRMQTLRRENTLANR